MTIFHSKNPKFGFLHKKKEPKQQPPSKVYPQWTKDEVDRWCEQQFDLT